MSKRGGIIILFVFALIGLAIGLYVDYSRTFTNMKINLDLPNLSVAVYQDTLGSKSSANEKPVLTLSSSTKIHIKKGDYDFVIENNQQDYLNPVTKVTIGEYTGSVDIDPAYSAQKLSSLLSQEDATIRSALVSAYPNLPNYYTIGNDQLYEQGNWYGAVLSPSDPTIDRAVVIMKQDSSGKWVVAAAPAIVIGIPSHPNIPSSVIDQVDQL